MVESVMSVLVSIVKVLFVPLDLALGWLTLLGSLGALIAVGALTGFAVNLFQKYCSNQNLLGRRREDLKKLKTLVREAKDNKNEEKAARLLGLTSLISSKYALESLKPALYSVPPLCVLAMWVGARLNHEPVRPNENVEVIATFEDGASGFAYILPNENVVLTSPAIVPVAIRKSAAVAAAPADAAPETAAVPAPRGQGLVAADVPRDTGNVQLKVASGSHLQPVAAAVESSGSPVAHWNLLAPKEGAFQLQVRHGDERYSVPMSVYSKGGLPPEQATLFCTESETRDRLLSVELKLRETVPPAWWNVFLQSMGVYFIAALVFGLALRRVMGIQ